jgi:hypothetical protein
VSRSAWLTLALLVAHGLAAGAPAVAGGPPDPLERFRDLASTRLAVLQLEASGRSADDAREIYALLDEEIVQNVTSGGLFASAGFLQDRLEGFTDAWGGAAFRVMRVGSLVAVACHLGEGGADSVRVYGPRAGEVALLATLHHEGRASLHALPAGPQSPTPFLVVWDGAPSGRGSRALRLDLVRQRGDDVAVVWSTADVFPAGLVASDWRVRGADVTIRYELHYPGWIPGCEGQTEQEDVYRFVPERTTFVRAGRRLYDGWHAVLHQAVGRILSALDAGDQRALAVLVPEARLRAALPVTLAREPACDATSEANGPVSVAAVAGGRRPWTLTFQRAGTRWRLTAAGPVIQ